VFILLSFPPLRGRDGRRRSSSVPPPPARRGRPGWLFAVKRRCDRARLAKAALASYVPPSTFGRTIGPFRSGIAGRTFRLLYPDIDEPSCRAAFACSHLTCIPARVRTPEGKANAEARSG